LGALLVTNLSQLIEWTESLQSENFILDPSASPASNPIEELAEALITPGTGIERHLLLKSLQEALFGVVGLCTSLTTAQLITRLRRSLERDTDAALFIRRFLSMHIFNHVWFYTCELFRLESVSPKAFEREVEEVGRICERSIAVAYERVGVLDASKVNDLIQNLERELWGLQAQL
jgi:hypothetical protein